MKQYELKSGILDRQRKLFLSEDFVEFENRDLKGHEFTRLNKADIVDFKHAMDWLVWYKFTVGRKFSITFKDRKNNELRIVFKSYLGANSHYSQIYSEVVDFIWQYYHQDIVNKHLDKYYNSEELTVQGITIDHNGIELPNVRKHLSWNDVGIKEYYKYFAIYHKDNPQTHFRVSYNEYETETLWSILKTILKEKESTSVNSN